MKKLLTFTLSLILAMAAPALAGPVASVVEPVVGGVVQSLPGGDAGASVVFDYVAAGGSLQERTHAWPLSNTRATARTVVRGGQVLTVAAGQPAFGDAGGRVGLDVQPAATNLLTHSGEFDHAVWAKSNVSVTANAAIAPGGLATADKLVANSVSTTHRIYRNATLALDDTTYCLSMDMKAGGIHWGMLYAINKAGTNISAYFDLSTGSVGGTSSVISSGVDPIGDGWYRCWITFDSESGATSPLVYVFLAAGNNVPTFQGDDSAGIYLDGAQLEVGTVPTARIPTDDTPVSCAADGNGFPLGAPIKNIASVEEPAPTAVLDQSAGNIVLATVAGGAMVMPDEGSAVDLSAYGGYVLKVTDTSDRVAWARMGAAGIGLTLGSELVTNGRFDTDTTGWALAVDTTAASVAGGHDGNCLEVTDNRTLLGYVFQQLLVSKGDLLYVDYYFKKGTGDLGIVSVGNVGGTGPTYLKDDLSDANWTRHSSYATSDQGGGYINLGNADTDEPETQFFDEVSVKQITAPPTTGVWLESTAGAADKTWAYIQSGFNPNAITEWAIYPASQWQARGTLLVKGWVPGFSVSDIPASYYSIIASSESVYGPLFFSPYGSGRISADDGANAPYVALPWIMGQPYDLAARWDSDTNKMQVCAKPSTASLYTCGAEASFDGAFALGSKLWLGYSPQFPFQVGSVQFFNKPLSPSQLAWMDSLKEWVAMADDYYPARALGGM